MSSRPQRVQQPSQGARRAGPSVSRDVPTRSDDGQRRSFYRGENTGRSEARQFPGTRRFDDRSDDARREQFRNFYDRRGEPRTQDSLSRGRRDVDWRDRVFRDDEDLEDRRERIEERLEDHYERLEDRFEDRFDDDDRRSDRWDDRFDSDRNFGRHWGDDWRRRADRVRRDWHYRDRREVPFRYGWWDNQHSRWPVFSPWRYSRWRDRPYYWWSWTPARQFTNWITFNWRQPYYWDYGPGQNIYFRDDYVYYDNQRIMRADEYYRYIYDLAHDVPSIDQQEAEEMDWRPFGVFALIRESESDSYRALQLAVNRQGVLTGTYYNRQNGHVHPVTGRVDERTQRAAWAFADGQHEQVAFETSVYNLTEPESTMMVHFGPRPNQSQVWRLVRLEQPEETLSTLPQNRSYELP